MEVKRIVVGSLEENCYILKKDDCCLLVDPGDEFERIKEVVGDKKVLGILITHHHFDHVGALQEALDYYSTSLYDFHSLEEKQYKIGPFQFEVIYNPGHSQDSISFFFFKESMMFVGDFIFLESIGRYDLEGGSFSEMKKSIEKLKQMDVNLTLYPGHGLKTTLEYEKKHNSFF